MAPTLDVYIHDQLTGHLIQDDHGQMHFQYDPSWLGRADARPLSQSLPLRSEAFEGTECRGFFGGILPEGAQREVVAKNLGVSARNDFALLELIGGDCAGAVTFIPESTVLPKPENAYRPLSEEELAETIRKLPRRPLLAGEDGVRLSLAGAQNKLAVQVLEGVISVPMGGAPSTHILKPANPLFEGLIQNEALCMSLAKALRLPVANVAIRDADGLDYLLVERYDRVTVSKADGLSETLRLHQEDFCQALGFDSDHKYQNEGGPSLAQCFNLLRGASSTPVVDLRVMTDAVIFNFLIGNHDAHGKNFSLLYQEGRTSLAPLYDLVCTVAYPDLSKKMAMKIGSKYESEDVFPRHFEAFAQEVRLAKPLVRRRVPELAQAIVAKLPELEKAIPQTDAVVTTIRGLCERTLARFSAGS